MAKKEKKPNKALGKVVGFLLVFAIVAWLVVRLIVPAHVEAQRNKVFQEPPYSIPPKAVKLHAELLVADMHADTLLWSRDLLHEASRGHVDLPRLRRANVALQCFTVVTKSPKGQNVSSNSANADDNITLLAIAQGWPPASWTSLYKRAIYQAKRLEDAVARSAGQLRLVRWKEDLIELLENREEKKNKLVGGWLGIEGAHCLEGKIEHVDGLYDAGFRMVGLTHFFDNELGGSAHGEGKKGLSAFGKEVVKKLEEKKILIDLAHASPAMIKDVLAICTRPPVVSHTGLKGVHNSPRNLSDEEAKAIAGKGGLIGIGFWKVATGGNDVKSIVKSIQYAIDLVGVKHVALGSDFDGSVVTPFDVTGLPLLTQGLIEAGLSDSDIERVMGGNLIRLLKEYLPRRPESEKKKD